MRSTCLTVLAGLTLLLAAATTACGPSESPNSGTGNSAGTATNESGTPGTTENATGEPKVLQVPMRGGSPQTLDPVLGSTAYENRACAQPYETLLQYKYLVRPPELEPLLLTKMPEVSDDGMIWKFELKPGVHFHDDACFPGGKGREMTSDDVLYSFRRFADPAYRFKNWWLVKKTIKGFDAYKDEQAKKVQDGGEFDYDAPVAGLIKVDDRRFEIHLSQPVGRFPLTLAMFQFSIVPREAVEKYGEKFARHPVGTGPFVLREESDWVPGSKLVFHRNPNYHHCVYPSEASDHVRAQGYVEPAGQKLPLVDRIEITLFNEDQPMWLKFDAGEIGYTQVPPEYFGEAYVKRRKTLRDEYAEKGIVSHALPLLDFIFRGFNMEDDILGDTGDDAARAKKKKLRQAISLAIDLDEFNEVFYNGINVVYDGPIPPSLNGYPKDGKSDAAYRGPDLDRAKRLLAEAGYPNGEGLPAIDFYSSTGGNNKEQAELLSRQLKKIGIEIKPHLSEFPTLIEFINNKKAPFFGFAWGSDYRDAENNLALFYGPNKSPGSNHYNYTNPEFDQLYEQILVMLPSSERTKILEQMRDMVLEDVPYVGSMARTRYYLVNPWMKNFLPSEDFYNWLKYVDVDDSARPRAGS